jgi:hypothetical protein
MRINNLFSKEGIIKRLEESNNEIEFLVALYQMAIAPEKWDNVKTLNGFPIISEDTSKFIIDQANKKFDVFGFNMLWLNKGFASDQNLKDWKVKLPEGLITLK